jgi:sensor histidine kinase regulating citrate/malate metabolism
MVPSELFDSVAENLLQNAIAKAQQHANTKITVTFDTDRGGCLTICDSGDAMPTQVANKLFSVPVPSRTGLGIGLYQAARQAEQAGYSLALVSNESGNVSFELRKTAITG